jgi:hypothetical protein
MILQHLNKIFFVTVVPITIIMFFTVNFYWTDNGIRKTTIDGDGRGHYIYLPAVFIYHTVDFKEIFDNEKEQRKGFIGHNFHKINNIYINKFAIGTAVLISPFFIVAHIIAKNSHFPADGFSLPYQYAVAIASIFWLIIGLFFLFKLLKEFDITNELSLLTVIFLVLATNLFHYAFLEVSLSHLYSFSVITVFLYYSKRLLNKFSLKYLIVCSFLLGTVVLIRQINILAILAVPFLAENSQQFISTVKNLFSKTKYILITLFLFIGGFSPQLIINYLQTGKFYIYGYQNEGFNFLHPEVVKFLFSFQKGWFIYTPSMLLIIPALINIYKINKYRFFAFTSFSIVLIYIFSSWWNWFFGDSFGMRPMVDFYSIFAVIIAVWLKNTTSLTKFILFILLTLLSALNIFQSYQYSKGIIHVDSMDFDSYKYVFLKTNEKYRNIIGDNPEYFFGKLSEKPLIETSTDFLNQNNDWNYPKKILQTTNTDLPAMIALDDHIIYGPVYKYVADSSFTNKKLYMKLQASYMEIDKNSAIEALFITDIKDKTGKRKFYKSFRLKKLPDNFTGKIATSKTGIKLPILEEGDIVKTYIWNKGKKEFYLFSMKLSVYQIEQ